MPGRRSAPSEHQSTKKGPAPTPAPSITSDVVCAEARPIDLQSSLASPCSQAKGCRSLESGPCSGVRQVIFTQCSRRALARAPSNFSGRIYARRHTTSFGRRAPALDRARSGARDRGRSRPRSSLPPASPAAAPDARFSGAGNPRRRARGPLPPPGLPRVGRCASQASSADRAARVARVAGCGLGIQEGAQPDLARGRCRLS